jgi:hypothetical protein
MIEQLPCDAPNCLAFKLSGKLHDEDYKTFVPLVDQAISQEGKVRLLSEFHDFHGWDGHTGHIAIVFTSLIHTAENNIFDLGLIHRRIALHQPFDYQCS